ncbi:MAG: hypothetical protein AB7U63_18725, partial [Porticoccaceae bacterium]
MRRPCAVGAAAGYALRVTHSAPSINLYQYRVFAQLDRHHFHAAHNCHPWQDAPPAPSVAPIP